MLDLNQLQPGDRAIILLHPIHWHKGSVRAEIESFSIPGQKSCKIDTLNSRIIVEMPYGTNLSSLTASFSLSPGAYAKVSGTLQHNTGSLNNYNFPVIYRVYAENRNIQRDWLVEVHNAKVQANFISFEVQGLIGPAKIDTLNNTIVAEISKEHSGDTLRPSFVLSEYSQAWIDSKKQISNESVINFSHPVIYKIISKDSLKIKKWKVRILVRKA